MSEIRSSICSQNVIRRGRSPHERKNIRVSTEGGFRRPNCQTKNQIKKTPSKNLESVMVGHASVILGSSGQVETEKRTYNI